MTKKTNSTVRFMVSIVFAIILCLAMAVPAFASDPPNPWSESKTPDVDAEAVVTKVLQMPIGTTTPTIANPNEFVFEFTAVSLNDVEAKDVKDPVMPTIADKKIAFSAADTGDESTGVKIVWKESTDFIAGIDWSGRAGEYVYKVTEKQNTYPIADAFKEQMVYSKAEYELVIYVDNKDNSEGVYVVAVVSKITKKDDGTAGGGGKGTPEPGGGEDHDYSQAAFTNIYTKNNGGTNPTDTVLSVSKKVDGLGADQTKTFEFSIKVQDPAIGTKAGTYKAYVLNENNAVVTPLTGIAPSGSIKGTAPNQYIEFATNTPLTINLKHNQRLSFIDLPVGAVFDVTEVTPTGYTASYELTSYENNTPSAANTATSAGASLSIPASQHIADKPINNVVDYLNVIDSSPITGVGMDNLPFVVLIIVLVGGIAGYAVFRTRRSARHSA